MEWFTKNKTDLAVTEPKKSTKELVLEIHNTFNTEVDRLLADADIRKTVTTNRQAIIDKAERLKKLGFKNTKEVSISESERSRMGKLERFNDKKSELADTINYFSNKYPLYKFITEESVRVICRKYGLVYGDIVRYIGVVPDRNLLQMEKFKIDKGDICWTETKSSNYEKDEIKYMDETTASKEYRWNSRDYDKPSKLAFKGGSLSDHFYDYNYTHTLEIAAPLKDFNTEGMELNDFQLTKKKVEIPDPVVLQPIIRNGTKYYLIVTAWGEEAGDDLVVNNLFN